MFAREPSNSSPAFSVPLPEFSAGDVHQYFRRVRRVQDANSQIAVAIEVRQSGAGRTVLLPAPDCLTSIATAI